MIIPQALQRFFLCLKLIIGGAMATATLHSAELLREFPDLTVNARGTSVPMQRHLPLSELQPVFATVDTVAGQFALRLFPEDAPVTVENFWAYTRARAYRQTLVHRLIPRFVLQTGSFMANLAVPQIKTFDPIVNEFGRSNVRGTVAMAKLEDNPDSATSGWFINLADNSANLDNQNGGFTVFAEVVGTGMYVVDQIASIPTWNAGGAFGNIPLLHYTGYGPVMLSHLVAFRNVTRHSFAAESSDPRAIEVRVNGRNLVVRAGSLPLGRATVRVMGIDAGGNKVEGSFEAVAEGSETFVGMNDTPAEGTHVVSFTVNHLGALTGTLRTVAGVERFRGVLDLSGEETLTIPVEDGKVVALKMDSFRQFVECWYGLEADVSSGDLDSFLLERLFSSPVDLATPPLSTQRLGCFLLPEESNDERLLAPGYFTLSFDRLGMARIVGALPSGMVFTASTPVARTDWDYTVSLPLFFNRSGRVPEQITALLNLNQWAPPGQSPVFGLLTQNSAADPMRLVHPEPILAKFQALGTYYNTPPQFNFLRPEALTANFSVRVEPPGQLDLDPIEFSGIWPANNRPRIQGAPRGARFQFQRGGLFTGTAAFPTALGSVGPLRPLPFRGLIMESAFELEAGLLIRGAGFQITPLGSFPVYLIAEP